MNISKLTFTRKEVKHIYGEKQSRESGKKKFKY
jgi:hypothetical protein